MKTARQIIVHGRVQGVWYRNWTVEAARDLGLTGWVRNRGDGTVEIHAEGEPAAIERLLTLAHEGPSAADVTGIDTADAAAEQGTGFEKRR